MGWFVSTCGAPVFTEVTESSNSGQATLVWDFGDADVEFVLEQSRTSDFSAPSLRYRGPDRTTVMSGLGEGVHYFRVRLSTDNEWSVPAKVEVDYISQGKLLALLAIGFLVVAMTVVAIVSGHLLETGRGEQ